SESGDRAERRAAMHAEFLRVLEQPFVQQRAIVPAVLVGVQAQVRADHLGSSAKNRRTTPIPASVISTEPTTWAPTIAAVQPYCWRSSSVTVWAEKVKKVVRPPQKPVVTNKRISGGRLWNWWNTPSAAPMTKPPSRFAASVPSGSAGRNGLSTMPKPQRSKAPAKAPNPTAKNDINPIRLPVA